MEHIVKKILAQRQVFGKRSNYTARIVANLHAKGKEVTRQHVYNVVTGRCFNLDVAEAFFEELAIEKKRRADLEALANRQEDAADEASPT